MTSRTIIGKHGGTTTIIGSPSLAFPKGRERRPIIYYVLCHYLHHLADGMNRSLQSFSIPLATMHSPGGRIINDEL